MTHVFVDDLDAPVLRADDRHHIERVLRLRLGDALTAADGTGRWRSCTLAPLGALEPVGGIEVEQRLAPPLTVAFAVTKGPRPELVVQKLTELGIDRIVPVQADRSVARWEGDRAGRHVERLQRVAREAAMQCGRARLPEVSEVVPFATMARERGVALADRDGAPPDLAHPTLLIGPEGGWSDQELAVGLPRIGLAEHVLRAETAAIAAGLVLTLLRSGRVMPSMAH